MQDSMVEGWTSEINSIVGKMLEDIIEKTKGKKIPPRPEENFQREQIWGYLVILLIK